MTARQPEAEHPVLRDDTIVSLSPLNLGVMLGMQCYMSMCKLVILNIVLQALL